MYNSCMTYDSHIRQVINGLNDLDRAEYKLALQILKVVRDTMKGTVYLCGNGGSAALSAHFANDLLKMGSLRAVDLGGQIPTIMAYGNDCGWDNMFAEPLAELLCADRDAVIGISCSGNSANVLNALEHASKRGCLVIGLTGNNYDSKLHKLEMDCIIHADAKDIRVQEDILGVVAHALTRDLQEER